MPKMPFDVLGCLELRAELVAAAAEKEFVVDLQAVRELDAGLIEALMYREDIWPDHEFRDRYAAILALRAVIRFLQAHHKWRAAARPLGQLQGALVDLDRGHQAAMLQPAPVAHRPVSRYETRLRGYAAGIMGALMKHAAMSKDQAAEWVSKRLRNAGHELATHTVIDWRKKALNHKRNPELHQAYYTVLGKPDWSQPLACAEQLMANLIVLQSQKGG